MSRKREKDQAGDAAGLTVYVETRAHDQNDDYRFLGAEPDTSWIDGIPGMETTMPCLALERTDGGWRLFANGFPSARRDYRDRVIGFAVILESQAVLAGPEAERLVGHLLAGIDDPDKFVPLTEAFDKQFPDDDWVARKLHVRDSASAREAGRRVREALAGLPPLDGGSESAGGKALASSWLWDARSGEARAAFMSVAGKLLAGQGHPGDRALVLNLISRADEVPPPAAPATVVVLAVRQETKPGLKPVPYQEIKPARPVVPGKRKPGPSATPAVRASRRRRRGPWAWLLQTFGISRASSRG